MNDTMQSQAPETAPAEPRVIGDDVLIILPVRNSVLFPQVVLPIAIKRERSVAGSAGSGQGRTQGGPVAAARSGAGRPGCRRAVSGRYHGQHRALRDRGRWHASPDLPGRAALQRAGFRQPRPVHGRAHRRVHPEADAKSTREIEARALRLRELAIEALQLLPQAPAELVTAIQSIESIPALVDLIASFLDLKPSEKQQVLATFDLRERLDLVLESSAAARRGAAHLARDRRARQGAHSTSGRRRRCCASGCARSARSSARTRRSRPRSPS